MKNILLLLTPVLLLSCGAAVQIPDAAQRREYNEHTTRLTIPAVVEREIADGNMIQINANSKSYEAIELMNYLIPLLDDRDHLSMSFWFLDGNSDSDILSWLNDDPESPSARELLFTSDPVLAGFTPYEEFLDGLREFYRTLEVPQNMSITTSYNAFVRFELFENREFDSRRTQYLVHSPVLNAKSGWEMPFKGHLYFMMIHDWLLENYRIIPVKDSVLEESYLTSTDEKEGVAAGSYLDGLILMGWSSEYTPFPGIESFITEENIAQALEFFPRQIIREKTNPATYLVNKKVSTRHRRISRHLEKLYSKITELEPADEE